MLEVFAISINNKLEDRFYVQLLDFLPKSKQERIQKFRFFEDAKRVILADIITRYLIAKKLNMGINKIEFSQNKFGKPYLDSEEGYYFNVSHSGVWVVCAIDSLELGVDVQEILPIDFDIAKRFFSSEEYVDLMRKGEDEKLSFFYDLWTLKESYIKALGKGMSIPLDSFSIITNKKRINIKTRNGTEKWLFNLYDFDSAYKLATCSKSQTSCNNVILLDINEVSEMFL